MGKRENAGEDGRLADPGERQGLAAVQLDRGRLGLGASMAQAVTSPSTFGFAPVEHVVLAGPVLAEPGADILGECLGVLARGLGRQASAQRLRSTACRLPRADVPA